MTEKRVYGLNTVEYLKNYLENACEECADEMTWGLFRCENIEQLNEELKKMSIIHRTRLAGRYDAYYSILKFIPEILENERRLNKKIEELQNEIDLLKLRVNICRHM